MWEELAPHDMIVFIFYNDTKYTPCCHKYLMIIFSIMYFILMLIIHLDPLH